MNTNIAIKRHRQFPVEVFNSFLRCLAAAMAFGVCGSLVAQTTQYDWINTTNSSHFFDISGNWNPAGPPSQSTHRASFNALATYDVVWDNLTGNRAVGKLSVSNGTVSFRNVAPPQFPRYSLVTFGNGQPNIFDLWLNATNFTISGLTLDGQTGATIRGHSQLTIDGAHPAGSLLSVDGAGLDVTDGTLQLINGGLAITHGTVIGTTSENSLAQVRVDGVGSHWTNSGNLLIGNSFVSAVQGNISIENGGVANSYNGLIAHGLPSTRGVANVIGPGSLWSVETSLDVGFDGTGFMNILDEGLVHSNNGTVGGGFTSSGTVTLLGHNSQWQINNNLTVGSNGTGLIKIDTGSLVHVGGQTKINPMGTVNLTGGRFEFGTASLTDFNRVIGTSGSVAGVINQSGITNVANLTGLQNTNLDLTGVELRNSGKLFGSADLGNQLTNLPGGRVETIGSERMRFAGPTHSNEGRINIYGGQIEFAGQLTNNSSGEVNNYGASFVANHVTNNAGGFVSGRGQFEAWNGWDNSGVMAFSSGTADIVGDVNNLAGGKILTSGNGTTTFYGDVVHRGSEIRTSAGSNTVFLGDVTGAGDYTGSGRVFFEGDLRPGNSPATINFGGDLVFGSEATTTFEFMGEELAAFDRMLIEGSLYLGNSELDIALLDGFHFEAGMRFLIADVNGGLFGTYKNLEEEGDLVRTFGDTKLFITYRGFDGNGGVGLYALAIPEPGSMALYVIGLGLVLICRQRTNPESKNRS